MTIVHTIQLLYYVFDSKETDRILRALTFRQFWRERSKLPRSHIVIVRVISGCVCTARIFIRTQWLDRGWRNERGDNNGIRNVACLIPPRSWPLMPIVSWTIVLGGKFEWMVQLWIRVRRVWSFWFSVNVFLKFNDTILFFFYFYVFYIFDIQTRYLYFLTTCSSRLTMVHTYDKIFFFELIIFQKITYQITSYRRLRSIRFGIKTWARLNYCIVIAHYLSDIF